MKIEQATPSTITELWKGVEPEARSAGSLEQGAQALATALHTAFGESVVIARVFVTVPFGALPPANSGFVRKLADSAGASAGLKPATPVLSLVGTHGQETDWTDRRKSKGHMGIPLISSAFVGAIPMISRLLKELGVPLDWVDSHDSEIIKKMNRAEALFFVDNAASAVDHANRKIIAAQDFVTKYKVNSVFGAGEGYAGGEMLAIVVFCRDALSRAAAERFLPLAEWFVSATGSLVGSKRIFANG